MALISMPNLGSYLNRTSCWSVLGRSIEVSKEVPAGILGGYRGRLKDGKPLGRVRGDSGPIDDGSALPRIALP